MILSPAMCWNWDHLRVCGADSDQVDSLIDSLGSSPRVRSRQAHSSFGKSGHGIISACAEQTRSLRS